MSACASAGTSPWSTSPGGAGDAAPAARHELQLGGRAPDHQGAPARQGLEAVRRRQRAPARRHVPVPASPVRGAPASARHERPHHPRRL
uniref:Uncharacterized protein n=1 Tax=Arundo donax TaxID=35708 RepID=A0A0A8YPY3_ARUDO